MNKNTFTNVNLNKGEVRLYDFGEIKLYAYKTVRVLLLNCHVFLTILLS